MQTSTHNITFPQLASLTLIERENNIVITDENIFKLHSKKFKKYSTIVIKSGEESKTQSTVNNILKQLIKLGANRATTLVGIGGGVVTDITGYVASVYMRGINFGFVPTTLLALVDASIGGKNGINLGVFKNMIGTINQPNFIFKDLSFLNTLPQLEWQNGFAEIIKHACIKDATMFAQLQNSTVKNWQRNRTTLGKLIDKNAGIKLQIVVKDMYEIGERKLLNFGHTLGHALENKYKLSHGFAIAIGMVFACKLSSQILGFKQTKEVVDVLKKYDLPTDFKFNKNKVFDILCSDKKREKNKINFILLKNIGEATIVEINLKDIKKALQNF